MPRNKVVLPCDGLGFIGLVWFIGLPLSPLRQVGHILGQSVLFCLFYSLGTSAVGGRCASPGMAVVEIPCGTRCA